STNSPISKFQSCAETEARNETLSEKLKVPETRNPNAKKMYADREEADTKRSIKDRLNGSFRDNSGRRRQIAGKRQRQDDKWEHDLYEDNDPQVSNRKVDARDLRLKLQRKSFKQSSQSGTRSLSGVRDLREKLSGTMVPQPVNADPPKTKLEAAKPVRRSTAVGASAQETKKVTNPASRKKTSQKALSKGSAEGWDVPTGTKIN
ncbi:Sterile alpha motif domain-containing protein, partial [Prunus dulcis]